MGNLYPKLRTHVEMQYEITQKSLPHVEDVFCSKDGNFEKYFAVLLEFGWNKIAPNRFMRSIRDNSLKVRLYESQFKGMSSWKRV